MSELETANAEAVASVSESPVPAPATPAPAEAPSNPREAQDAAVTADLMKVWEKNNPPRSEDGKFAPRNPEAPAQAEATGETNTGQTQETPAVEQARPAIAPPASWSRETSELWAKLPPEAQEIVAKRESEAHAQISRLGQTAKAAEPLLSVIEQNRELFARRQVAPEQGVAALLNAQRKLDENPVAAIGWLAQQYGVDLSMFANPDGSQSATSPVVASLQAEIQSLKRELAETSSTVRETVAERQAAKQEQYLNAVQSFLSDKSLTYEDEARLVPLVEAEKKIRPDATPQEILDTAYKRFLAGSPEHFEKLFQDRLAAEQAKQAEEAKKKASEAKKLANLNVRSSPAGSSNAKSWDENLAEAYWAAQRK